MENFADFLPFSEEVQEAFDNYHLEASSLTIQALPKSIGSIIGRVVWRSPLLKIGANKDKDVVHLTLMDADHVEITGTAWGKIAQRFDEVLQQNQIYKFANVVPISKSVHQKVKNDHFESRVLNQLLELRFSGLVDPELVRQNPYPALDQNQFRMDYKSIHAKQVTSLVGLVNAQFSYEGQLYICLSNGRGECIGVTFSQEKLEELKGMQIKPRFTVLGILGAGKLRDYDTKTTGDKIPTALYKTFTDTIFMLEPQCEATQQLVQWRNELPDPEAEMQQLQGNAMDQ